MKNAVLKFMVVVAVVVVAACGKDDKNNSGDPGAQPQGGPGGPSTPAVTLSVSRTAISRSYTTVNGYATLSFVFMTFKPSDASAKIADVKVKINRSGEAQTPSATQRIGVVDEASINSMTFSTDPDRNSEARQAYIAGHKGEIFVMLNDASKSLVVNGNEFVVNFTSNSGSKSVSVLTESME